ncbi:MAG TPA: helix-turn-helix transcriptional regulator [Pyrinomonadaceae bacterium]|nr:helix-turn-helix transcriptional regulator [Pyrinomonadaceae bacterium]
MGKGPRPKPKRLAEKLLRVRNALGLSQHEMHRRLGVENDIDYTTISKYELGRNEPSLMTLLAYARVAGVHMEDLVDDDLDLPETLPGRIKYEGIKLSGVSRKNRRNR